MANSLEVPAKIYVRMGQLAEEAGAVRDLAGIAGIDVVGADRSGECAEYEAVATEMLGTLTELYSNVGMPLKGRYKVIVSDRPLRTWGNPEFIQKRDFGKHSGHPFFSSKGAEGYDGCIFIYLPGVKAEADKWERHIGAGPSQPHGQGELPGGMMGPMLLWTMAHESAHALQSENMKDINDRGNIVAVEGLAAFFQDVVLRNAGFGLVDRLNGYERRPLGEAFDNNSMPSQLNEMITRYDDGKRGEVSSHVKDVIAWASDGVKNRGDAYIVGSALFTAVYLSEGKSLKRTLSMALGAKTTEDVLGMAEQAAAKLSRTMKKSKGAD